MKLNAGQQAAVAAIKSGANVFLTGEGGTGKSVAIRAAVDELAKIGRKVVLCAPTGIAAHNIGGATIHSVFRFDLAPKVADALKAVQPSQVVHEADTIIIDEIGMVRRDLLDAIADVVMLENESRVETSRPFLQLVVVGDFSQLPPVVTQKDKPALVAEYGKETAASGFYAFESVGWDTTGFHVCMLTEPMRQADPEFVQMLNRARVGDASCLPYFNKLAGRGEVPQEAVSIVARNKDAAAINLARLAAVKGKSEKFRGDVEGEFKPADMAAPEVLELKEGARVMAVSNDAEAGYVNGSTGVVAKLHAVTAEGLPAIAVKLDNGGSEVLVKRHEWENVAYEVVEKNKKKHLEQVTLGTFKQYPLKLAYAITYHKSQGQTLNAVSIDPATFAPGQLYVGLSRATSAAGIYLTKEIQPKNLIADPAVVEFYEDTCGWDAPEPATGNETPDTSKTNNTVAGNSKSKPKAKNKKASKPKAAKHETKPAEPAAADPTDLAAIQEELHDLLTAGGRAWVRVYELIDLVARERKYTPEYRSFSAWIKAEAQREGVDESILWHRKSAGDFYKEWAATKPDAPTLAEGQHLSENNLNLVRKIAKANPERGDELMLEMLANQMSTKALRSELRELNKAARAAKEEPSGTPAAAPKCRAQKDALTLSVACETAADFERVLAALKAAGVVVEEA